MKVFAEIIQLNLCIEFYSTMIVSIKKYNNNKKKKINMSQGSYTRYSVYGGFVNINLLFHN